MLDLVSQLQQEFEILYNARRYGASGVAYTFAEFPESIFSMLRLGDGAISLQIAVVDALAAEPRLASVLVVENRR
jgi:hypothetical protein